MHLDTRDPRMAVGVFATALILAVATGRVDVSPVWDLMAGPGSQAGRSVQADSPAGEPYDEPFGGTAKPAHPEVGVRRQGVDPTDVLTVDGAKRDATDHPKGMSVVEIGWSVSTPPVAGDLAAGSGGSTVDAETPTTIAAAGGEVAPPKAESAIAATKPQPEPKPKPEEPAAKSEPKPKEPAAKPEPRPEPKPEEPPAKPEKPVAKPDKPVAKPDKPVAKPEPGTPALEADDG